MLVIPFPLDIYRIPNMEETVEYGNLRPLLFYYKIKSRDCKIAIYDQILTNHRL